MFTGVKAIIFDCDGTVADTIGAIRDAINIAREATGQGPLDYEGTKAGMNRGTRFLVKKTIVEDSRLDDEEYIDNCVKIYYDAYSKTYVNTKECYEGIIDAIRELKARGYKVGILSNKPIAILRPLVEQLFGKDFFEVIVGPTGSIVKPDVRLTNEALSGFETPLSADECVLVGDSQIDVATAKNAGMRVVCAAWGFLGRQKLEELGGDVIIDHPSELPGLFE